MKSLFIIVFITIISYAFCYEDKGRYLELTNLDKEAYLVAENCEKVYICGKHSKSRTFSFLGFGDDILENCYYRNKLLDGKINVDTDEYLEGEDTIYISNYNNPDNCSFKRYAHIATIGCYLSSDGNWKTKIDKDEFYTIDTSYYDIDIENNMVLTVNGWCTYDYDNIDADWMKYVDNDLKINQINIPGTHDSGTYDIGKSWKMDNTITDSAMYRHSPFISIAVGLLMPIIGNGFNYYTAQTQDLNISDQLKNGIRYLDVRLSMKNKNETLYLSHGSFKCYDSKNKDYLYFKSVIYYCVEFLLKHSSETIILHLKKENIDESIDDNYIVKLIEAIGKEYDKYLNVKYKDYFFIPENIDEDYTNDYMPTLGDVRGKIVFFSRTGFFYIDYRNFQPTLIKNKTLLNVPIGFQRNLQDKANCTLLPHFGIKDVEKNCEPVIENNFRYQDNYQLYPTAKWPLIENMIIDDDNFIYIRI